MVLFAQSCNGSLCGNLSFETKLLIPSMISCLSLSELTVGVMNVDRQKNGSNCGVLFIAYAFDICSGLFDHKDIRQHLTGLSYVHVSDSTVRWCGGLCLPVHSLWCAFYLHVVSLGRKLHLYLSAK